MKVVAIIPARYASTRLPGKPLLPILGKPMILRVYEAIENTHLLDEVIVATDDERILKVCQDAGAKAVMTSTDHHSGTDRVSEVAQSVDADLIVNLQGDEPLITPYLIEHLIGVMKSDKSLSMGTLARELKDGELEDSHVVKVWIDRNGHAVYFAREPKENHRYYAHLGLYIFRKDFLLKFTSLSPTDSEKKHRLEQLRALDNGFNIGVDIVSDHSIGVDTEEDLIKVEEILKNKKDFNI